MTWQKVKLGELGIIKRGKSKHRPRNAPFLYGGKYPFVQTSDIKNANLYLSSYTQTYSEEGLQQSHLWDEGTLCITIAANIAESAILKFKSCFPDSIVGFQSYPNISDIRFVKYLLDFYKTNFQSISKGTTQDNLSVEKINSIEMDVPDFDTQTKIASILSAYDDLIENNTRRIQILEQMAQTIYKEWFVKFRIPNCELRITKEGIPEGWEVKNYDSICGKLTDGTHDTPKPVEEGFHLVTGRNIKNGFIDFSDCYYISKTDHKEVMKRSKPEFGDIIFSNIGTLGNIHFVQEKFEYSIKNVALFKPREKLYSNYLFIHLKSEDTLDNLKQQALGTSQKFFSLEFLRKQKIVKPNDTILHAFNKMVEPLIQLRYSLYIKNQNLRRTRDLLLPKLMSGEVEV